MVVTLFDLENGKVLPSIHCYNIKFLKNIIDNYPDNHIKIFSYLFYLTCPNPEINPFFNLPELDKEGVILKEIDADFSPEDDLIVEAVSKCKALYETPVNRAYESIKISLDRISNYLKNTPITDGKDGNIGQIRSMMKDFDDIRRSFKGVYNDLIDEQRSRVKGNQSTAYDMGNNSLM